MAATTTPTTPTPTRSRHDPYSEIETYLRQAQEEISAVFGECEVKGGREEERPRPRTPIRPPPPEGQASPPKIRKLYLQENRHEASPPSVRRLSLAPPVPPRRRGVNPRKPRRLSAPSRTPASSDDIPLPPCPPRPDPRLQEWSHTLLRDFHSLVEAEIEALHHHHHHHHHHATPHPSPTLPQPFSLLPYRSPALTHLSSSVPYSSLPPQHSSPSFLPPSPPPPQPSSSLVLSSRPTSLPHSATSESEGSGGHDEDGGGTEEGVRGGSGPHDMGASHSGERGGVVGERGGGGYKTYTLPRASHRSVSLSGAGAPSYRASAAHPDDPDVSCRLLRVNPRLSRSHSLDDAAALSPWALHHLAFTDDPHTTPLPTPASSTILPTPANSSTIDSRVSFNGGDKFSLENQHALERAWEGMSAPQTPLGGRSNKVRKTGLPQMQNEHWRPSPPQSKSQAQSQPHQVNGSNRVSNGWGEHSRSSDDPPTPPSPYREDLPTPPPPPPLPYLPQASPALSSNSSSAFTPADLQEGTSESWAWADQEDACCLTDRPCDPEMCTHCRDKLSTTLTDSQSELEPGIRTPPTDTFEMRVTPPEDIPMSLLNDSKADGGEKFALGRRSEGALVGLAEAVNPLSPLDGRRHTLPAPGASMLSPPRLTFTTSSWETLPPADELEVELEEKPITGSIVERPNPPSPASSHSLNSSLSSLSHLSIHPDNSECDSWPSSPAGHDHFPHHVLTNSHHLHPHVFPGYKKETVSPQQHTHPSEPITGVLQLTPTNRSGDPGDIILSVNIPPHLPGYAKQSNGVHGDLHSHSLTPIKVPVGWQYQDIATEDAKTYGKDLDLHSQVASLTIIDSESSSIDKTFTWRQENDKQGKTHFKRQEDSGRKGNKMSNEEEARYGEVVRPPPRYRSFSLDETHSGAHSRLVSCSIQTSRGSAALDDFLQAVESRMRPGSHDQPPSPASTQASTPLSYTAHDLSSPTVVLDAFTQTTPTYTPAYTPSHTPLATSRASSDTWVSECGCDDLASLEPCASSLALSGTEDDYDDDDDDDDEWSPEVSVSSSSPPPTPASPTRDDDSSLSLSESLDTLDLNGESGIGTVSTRPSISPRPSAALDLSGSNLSSEDTGLENSFERQIRRYIPHGRGSRESDHYRRRRARARHTEQWVRLEDQTTQTDPDPPLPASYAEGSSQDSLRESNEMMGGLCDARLVRHTHSEPRLHAGTPGTGQLRGVCSEAALPPLPYTPRTSFAPSAPTLPTLTEDKPPVGPGRVSRPRYLPLVSPEHPQASSPGKACSAPALETRPLPLAHTPATTPSEDSSGEAPTTLNSRAHSSKELAELEALEACKWLRAAGFPQYAQMYEELQFPLDLVCVERDHSFLDPDSLQALFRRLRALNRCARIRLDSARKNKGDESDDDECALSGNWQFQRHSRRWSRVVHDRGPASPGGDGKGGGTSRGLELPDELPLGQFKRSGSERLRDGAKAILRRMESLKNKKKKRQNRDGVVISGPKVLDEANMEARVAELGCVDLSPDASPATTSPATTSPLHHPHHSPVAATATATATIAIPIPLSAGQIRNAQLATPEDSSSLASQTSSTPLTRGRRKKRFWRRAGGGGEEGGGCGGAYSDSECSPPTWRHYLTDANSNKMTTMGQTLALSPEKRGSLKVVGRGERPSKAGQLRHTGSLNYGKESQAARENFLATIRPGAERREEKGSPEPPTDEERHSVYDNVPLIICNKSYHDYHPDVLDSEASAQEGSGSSECTVESRESPLPLAIDDEDDDAGSSSPRRPTVDRWHSFNRKSYSPGLRQLGTQINGFSGGQMLHLRKRALLRLTALMERYCPSNRSGWNWELPKFMRKIKTPDYRERQVFGVPLLVVAQRTGQPLPTGIQTALKYLRDTSLDQVGIFRKPGVRSRIQRLREAHVAGEDVQYANFGTCDIADMVKTYFRELPEVLLTNKLSEMFIAIFQYLPSEHRLEALQCAVLLLPDENREVLIALLTFLADVAAHSHLNQMHASNLAVCLAPSLFHLSVGGSGSSPLRRRAGGTPEHRDLSENKAAHQCLTLMIQQVSQVQCVPVEMLNNCRFTYLEHSQPVCLEDLGGTTGGLGGGLQSTEGDWTTYMNACVSALFKEARDRSRGWVHQTNADPQVELLYRKVGDGHPLRLWRAITEVEAPPSELLNRIIRERHLWDDSLLKWRVVSRLDRQAEVFQYMCNSMPPRSPVDYCVLRYWRSNLERGSCVVVETSVEHPDAPLLVGGVRGIVLASRYLIQPCGSGKSRITHISRVDMRGRTPEWYNKVYGHVTASHLTHIRQSFQHHAAGPESKV